MKQTDLMRRWEHVRVHFSAARSCLPDLTPDQEKWLQEWLDHNELGLALDDLEIIGGQANRPPAFWESLARAAELMEMPERAAKIRSRLN